MEDFVSFELAKKLQEKGFRYDKENRLDRLFMVEGINHPTIYQVLKWLRDDKQLHVIVATFIDQLNRCYTWGYEIWNISGFPTNIKHIASHEGFVLYDKASLAGIEYCLDNLI